MSREEQLGKGYEWEKVNQTHTAYDKYGRHDRNTKAEQNSLSTRETYSYDDVGPCCKRSPVVNTTTTFTYDYFGRRESMTDVNSGNVYCSHIVEI